MIPEHRRNALTEEPTDKPRDGASGERYGIERRPLLRALGAGAALTAGTGVATADGEEHGDNGDEDRDDEIDPLYGFATPDAGEVPANIEPDHEVELHVDSPEDPENPDHPTFFHFEPTGLHVDSGDVVQFTFTTPDHTVTAYHPGHGFQQRVPDGAPPFSSPVVNVGGAWLYRFEVEGVYDAYCGPHHVLGMVMRIVVGDLAEEDVPDYEDTFEGSQEPPLLAPFSPEFLEHELNALSDGNEDCEWPWLTPMEVLDADALDPTCVQSEGTVSFEAVLDDLERFGE